MKQNLYRDWMIRLQMFLAARPVHPRRMKRGGV